MAKLKSYLQKVNNMSPAAKASFWFVVSNIALKGMSFITTPIFTRMLDVADYGVTSIFVTWENVIHIFATLSLAGGVYNVAMTKFEEDINAYTSSMISLTAVVSAAVYAICIGINILFPQLFGLPTPFLIFMWVQTMFNAALTFWLTRKRFIYSYKSVIAYTFSNAILSPLMAIAAVWLFPESKAFAKIVGSGIWTIVIGAIFSVSILRKGKAFFHKQYWKFALRFNIPLLPHYLSSVLLNSSDKIMLDRMLGSVPVGYYSIAHSITGVVSIVTQSINSTLIPFTLQSIKKGQQKKLHNVILGCSMLIGVICILVVIFAREGILIFSTQAYMNAVWFVGPLAFSTLISFVTGLVGNIIFYYEKTKEMSAVTMISAAVNILLNYFGICYCGYVAVGYATLISSLLSFTLYYRVVKKHQPDLDDMIGTKWLLLIFAIFAVLTAYSMVFYNNLIMKIALFVVIAVLLVVFRKRIIAIARSMTKRTEDEAANE